MVQLSNELFSVAAKMALAYVPLLLRTVQFVMRRLDCSIALTAPLEDVQP